MNLRTLFLLTALVIGPVLTPTPSDAADQNLLKNADFTEKRPDGKPAPLAWYREGNCSLAVSQTDGLQVTVTSKGKKDGRFAQSIDVESGKTYIVSAEVKATVNEMAYLEIEFLNGGLEIKSMPRMDSSKCTTEWKTIELKVATREVKRFSVMCRFEQSDRAVGQTASFRKLKVVPE